MRINELFKTKDIVSIIEHKGYHTLKDVYGIQYKLENTNGVITVRGKMPSGNWSKILIRTNRVQSFKKLLDNAIQKGVLENFVSMIQKQKEELNTRIWWEDLESNNIIKQKVDVIKIIDGDTLHVKFPSGEIEIIRTRYIDTPEVGHYDEHNIYRKYDPEYCPQGIQALNFLKTWCKNQNNKITLNFRIDEDEELHIDKYGRVLAYLKGYSEDVVRKGLAIPMFDFFIPPTLKKILVEAMNDAKYSKIGLFDKKANAEKRRLLKLESELGQVV